MENPVNVAHYISELLFLHDCVVVPGFGGFVCSYAPARIHPAQHTFHPPSKQLVFNRHLQQNDGLLAHTLATAASCSFEVAMSAIQAFVNETNATLNSGRAVALHNVGQLSLDPERNIRFEADQEVNFLIDAFGLGSFQSMPIVRETPVAPIAPVAEKAPPVRQPKPLPNQVVAAERPPVVNRQRTRRRVVIAALLTPLVVAAIWLPMQRLNTNQLAGFGFFGASNNGKYVPVNWFRQLQTSTDTLPSPADLSSDTSALIHLRLAEGPAITVSRDRIAVVAESTLVARPQQPQPVAPVQGKSGTFYVIGGAFNVPANAENYRKLLERKGYTTTLLSNVRSQLTHISIANFGSREEAERFLTTIQDSIQGAWILNR